MRYQIASAAALALLVPALATAGTPGYVDASVGAIDLNTADLTTMGASGAVVAPLSGNWHVQFDGDLTRYQINGGGFSGSSLAAHVFHDGGDWAVGGLLDYQSLSSITFWTLGAEAQYTVGAFVFEAGAGFGTFEAFSNNNDTSSASASVTWYYSPDISVTGGINYRDVDMVSADWTVYSLDAEYRIEGTKFSVIGGYAFGDLELGFESSGWSIGLRYGFGDATLQGRRNEGPRWLRETTLMAIAPL